MVQLVGYIGALLTGIVLGMLGGGGAVITIPILVYVFKVDASAATGYSLLIVGITAALGSVQNLREKRIRYTALVYCGVPALLSIYATRRWLVHAIPDIIFNAANFHLTKNRFILLLLSIFMVIVGRNMTQHGAPQKRSVALHYSITFFLVSFIGVFIGMVGAGGGFLLIPLLLRYDSSMDFRNATATSLALVMCNSFIGFLGDVQANAGIEWKFLLGYTALSVVGVLVGIFFTGKIDNHHLRQLFGYFIFMLGTFIFAKELWTMMGMGY